MAFPRALFGPLIRRAWPAGRRRGSLPVPSRLERMGGLPVCAPVTASTTLIAATLGFAGRRGRFGIRHEWHVVRGCASILYWLGFEFARPLWEPHVPSLSLLALARAAMSARKRSCGGETASPRLRRLSSCRTRFRRAVCRTKQDGRFAGRVLCPGGAVALSGSLRTSEALRSVHNLRGRLSAGAGQSLRRFTRSEVAGQWGRSGVEMAKTLARGCAG